MLAMRSTRQRRDADTTSRFRTEMANEFRSEGSGRGAVRLRTVAKKGMQEVEEGGSTLSNAGAGRREGGGSATNHREQKSKTIDSIPTFIGNQ